MADSIGEVVLGISVEQAGAQQALQEFGKTAEQEANRAANSIDSLKQKLKEQQQQLSQLAIGTKEFESLRQEIAKTEAALKAATVSPLQAQQQAERERLAAAKRAAAEQAQIERQRYQASIATLNRLNEAERAAAKQREQIAKEEADRRIASQQRLQGIIGAGIGALGIGISAAAGAEFLRQSVQSAIELETVTRKLTNSLGQQGAAGALAFTRGLSDELGLSFKTLVGTFASFTAAATAAGVPLQQQKDLFAAVSKAAQQLGLSDYELQGSLLALQQVASKGVVQMEELRGQLGERLPIAFAAAAKGLGKTQQELIALVESGKLTANEFFPALTKGLNALTASSEGAPTAAQNLQKFNNELDNLKTTIGTDLLPTIIEAVKGLTDLVAGIAVVRDASKLGFSQGLATFLGFISEQGPEAVAVLRQLQQQFNLTDQQSRALFTDAVKNVGGTTTAFGELRLSAQQFQQVLAQLPTLAQQFRDKYPDTRGLLAEQEIEFRNLLELSKQQTVSIDSLNAKLKLQRTELNAVSIGSQRFQELTGEIRKTEQALKDATTSATAASSAVQATPSTLAIDFQNQALSLSQARLAITQQISQAEQSLAQSRLSAEAAILSAEEQRALQGVNNEQERAQIQDEFARKREELEVRQLDLKQRSLGIEQRAQIESLKLETQILAIAAKKNQLAAQAAVIQAQQSKDPERIRIAQEQLALAQKEVQITQQLNKEKIDGLNKVFQLRQQQLEAERQAALADNRFVTGKPDLSYNARSGIIEFDPAPFRETNQTLKDTSNSIGLSNDALIGEVRVLQSSINELTSKDWSVQVYVENQAGGASTVNTQNRLQ